MKLMIFAAGKTTCVFCDFAEDCNEPNALPAEWEFSFETFHLPESVNDVDLNDLDSWTIEEGWSWKELPDSLLTRATSKKPLSLAERINLQNEMAYADIEIELDAQKKVA